MHAIGWDSIEDAVNAWLEGATGLPAIWGYQGGQRPSSPYIEADFDNDRQIGHGWKKVDAAPDPVEHREVRVRHRAEHYARLTIQCFGRAPGDDDRDDAVNPLQVLSDAVAALPVYQDDIDEAGAGVGEIEAVTKIGGSRGKILEPRATVSVMLHLASEVETRTTYIQRFRARLRVSNPGGVEIENREFWIPTTDGFSDGFSAGFEVNQP